MKPHIRKERSITYRCPMWYCRGSGSLGIAETPYLAYWDWVWRVKRQAGVQ